MKKIKISCEAVYVIGILLLSLSVAMITASGFGVSMIVAPAYIVSLKVSFLTFGQAEYVVQGILFIVFCILMKKFKPVYLCSFLTAIIYGAVLDLWRLIIPHFNPNITPVQSLPLYLRIIYFAIGMLLTSLSVSLFFRTYFCPQVYDFFVKGVSLKYKLNRTKFKMCFDATFLLISIALTFILFKRLNGVGIGTVILTCCNGMLIGFFGKILDKHFDFQPKFPTLAKKFEIE
jgi:uncharacterized membrane protein YczE